MSRFWPRCPAGNSAVENLDVANVCLTFGAWPVYANCVTLALWLAIAVGVVVWLRWV